VLLLLLLLRRGGKGGEGKDEKGDLDLEGFAPQKPCWPDPETIPLGSLGSQQRRRPYVCMSTYCMRGW